MGDDLLPCPFIEWRMPKLRDATASTRKQDILLAFARLLHEQGWNAISMRKVAQATGMTTGAIYPHFASKAELVTTLIEQSLTRLHEAVDQAFVQTSAQAPSRAPLHAAALAFHDYFVAHPQDVDLGFYTFQGGQDIVLDKTTSTRLNQRLQAILTLFARGFSTPPGATPGPHEDAQAQALYLFLCGLMINARTHRDRSLRLNLRQHLLNYLARP